MACRAKLVVLALLSLLVGICHAGYAQLAPPAGWSTSAGATTWNSVAANAGTIANGTVRTGAALNVGGRTITVPVAMRFAANAGRFAAERAFLSPFGLGIAAVAWLASECFAYQGGQWVRTCGVPNTLPVSDGYEYMVQMTGYGWHSTWQEACKEFEPRTRTSHGEPGMTFTGTYLQASTLTCVAMMVSTYAGYNNQWIYLGQLSIRQASNCPKGWYVTGAGCAQSPPPTIATPQEIADKMAPKAIPDALPREMPGDWPVEPVPIVNPSPGTNPIAQPMREPAGNPVPVPDTSPQQYRQPWTRVETASTEAEPWRVSISPEDTVSTNPAPVTSAQSVTPESATGEPDDSNLCEKFPDALACAKLDTPKGDELSKVNQPISVTPDAGWGGNGSCPPARHLSVQGRDIPIPFDLFCQYMAGIRPIVIAMAWLGAGLILLGARGGD